MSHGGEPAPAPLASPAGVLGRRLVVAALLAAAAGCPPAVAAAAETVLLVMTEYRFTPDHLAFRQGVAYRLVMENRGKELHEFTAPAFLASITLANPDVLATGGKEVVVRPGERKELRFVPLRPGRYPMACADHDWAGMVGEIVIS